jgi:hypothetical protein
MLDRRMAGKSCGEGERVNGSESSPWLAVCINGWGEGRMNLKRRLSNEALLPIDCTTLL